MHSLLTEVGLPNTVLKSIRLSSRAACERVEQLRPRIMRPEAVYDEPTTGARPDL